MRLQLLTVQSLTFIYYSEMQITLILLYACFLFKLI